VDRDVLTTVTDVEERGPGPITEPGKELPEAGIASEGAVAGWHADREIEPE
jgi:hypothetical protein